MQNNIKPIVRRTFVRFVVLIYNYHKIENKVGWKGVHSEVYIRMLKKATTFLEKYNIIEFPIPIDIIENIINHEGIKIEVTKFLRKSSYYEDNNSKIIYLGCKGCKINYSCQQREYLVHETAHVYHCGNTAFLPSSVVDKNEGQAQAFAAYFLMPFGLFETYLARGENDYNLSERFGVTEKLVRYRKKLLKSILENGYYKKLRTSI